DERAASALAPLAAGTVQLMDDGRRLRAPVAPRHGLVTAVVRALDDAGVAVDDIEIHHPSLDDVFFVLTGHAAEEPVAEPAYETSDDQMVPTRMMEV
ncbi:MAG: daunorubicin/doxorubicin resistance ABC transporter ATP-binding protein DrrA, partial [Acidimicrobiia bacterium]